MSEHDRAEWLNLLRDKYGIAAPEVEGSDDDGDFVESED